MRASSHLLAVALLSMQCNACTIIAVTKTASTDGSVMFGNSDDGDGTGDPRYVYIQARDWPAGAQRPINPAAGNYPRFVGTGRSAAYEPREGQNSTQPLGHIDQVSHTFGYYEGDYGGMNERQLIIGESSCSASIAAAPRSPGGEGPLLCIDQLSRIAMERCDNARCAVRMMGALAERYGFFGVADKIDAFPNEAGEALVVADKQEAWVFHVLPSGEDPVGAIWVAQRVPEGHATVVANMFTIRNVDLTDTNGTDFMWSESMTRVAQAKGWWVPGTPLDFTKIYSYDEYYYKYYSGRRMWRALSLLAPSLNLSPHYNDSLRERPAFPFSVRPDKKVDLARLMSMMRDWYANTSFDMGAGLAAGPWGLPVRYDPEMAYNGAEPGAWERPIATFRSTYTLVSQARSSLPDAVGGVVWFGPHTALGTAYIPLLAGAQHVPETLSCADPRMVNRSCSHWAHRQVTNFAYMKFNAMVTDISAAQLEWEAKGRDLVQQMEKAYQQNPSLPAEQMAAGITEHAIAVREAWWGLLDTLLVKYADGFFWSGFGRPTGPALPGGAGYPNYPHWWLKAVGYGNAPH